MKCSFCGKPNEVVNRMIAASNKVAICDKCILQCVETLIYENKTKKIYIDSTKPVEFIDENLTREDADAASGC